MKTRRFRFLVGSSLLAAAAAASAQTGSAPAPDETVSIGLEEIVVTARRKFESAQDVPTTINAVTGAEIDKLNIKTFADIASVVPGLAMSTTANGVAASASVRGVNYDVNASGNNGTVEFYLNDAPISAGNLFQATYDIQQVELLRGPQGTLRGRASPSGSMTVTTRRPDLSEFGGFVNLTANDIGGTNAQAAVNIPIVSDRVGLRLAGVYDENENTRVTSVNNPTDPLSKTKSGRATLSAEPTDNLSIILTYQHTDVDTRTFDQVISRQEIIPGSAVINAAGGSTYPSPFVPNTPPPAYIRATDRLSVLDVPRLINNTYDNYNLQIQWAFAGQKLNYVGARNEQLLGSFEPADIGDYFSPTTLPIYQNFGQTTDSRAYATAHELRLSNEERIGGVLDYIVGAFYQMLRSPTDLVRQTPVAIPPGTPGFPPGGLNLINGTPIQRRGGNLEQSVFANVNAHFGTGTEVSGGLRYIKYEADGTLVINNVFQDLAVEDSKSSTTIYTVSVRQNFADNLMGYVNVGSSWRPGISAVGDFSVQRSPLETTFLVLPPEKSTSYEVGFKASFLDDRIRTALSLYYQKFDNYPYRSPSGVTYADYQYVTGTTTVAPPTLGRPFNFVAAVPAEVKGAELEVNFAATANWDMGLSAAISQGEIKDGFIPCDDYNPRDGVPDTAGLPPGFTATDLLNVTGGEHLSGCTVNQRSSTAPQWSGSVQSEYRLPLTDMLNSFIRGQLSIYGSSENDPVNSYDNYDGYEILNLYVGLRNSDGAWEVSLYGKNITDTERVLQLSNATMSGGLNGGTSPTNYYGGTNASGVVMTAPREFGLNLRYAFGSR